MEKCKCEWCDNVPNPSGKGYCRTHYDQMRKYGHVLSTRSVRNKNRINAIGDRAEVIITDRYDNYAATAIIDMDDVDRVSEHRWTMNGNGYVRTFIGTRPLYLHRFICEYDGELTVDHINRDKLDNRKCNLRVVSQEKNNYNKDYRGYHVIRGRKLSKPYVVYVDTKRGYKFHAYFATAEEARAAYLSAIAEAERLAR